MASDGITHYYTPPQEPGSPLPNLRAHLPQPSPSEWAAFRRLRQGSSAQSGQREPAATPQLRGTGWGGVGHADRVGGVGNCGCRNSSPSVAWPQRACAPRQLAHLSTRPHHDALNVCFGLLHLLSRCTLDAKRRLGVGRRRREGAELGSSLARCSVGRQSSSLCLPALPLVRPFQHGSSDRWGT